MQLPDNTEVKDFKKSQTLLMCARVLQKSLKTFFRNYLGQIIALTVIARPGNF